MTAALVGNGAEAEGLDFAPTMVAKASINYPTIRFRNGDAVSLPYESNIFDHVVCCYGVMHLERPDRAIVEAHRVLRHGGKYVFTQWAKDDDLLRIVSSAVLLACGFERVAVDRLNIEWKSDRTDALLELICGNAVRAAMLIEAQEPSRRAKIHNAIILASRANRTGNTIIIRRPTVMASGEKAAPGT